MKPILHLRPSEFNPAATLLCGQAFRWRRDRSGFEGIAGGRRYRVTPEGNGGRRAPVVPDASVPSGGRWIVSTGGSGAAAAARVLFDADTRLSRVIAAFPADDPLLGAATGEHAGLRLLRQDPWETVASFILSSTKSIAHITQLVEALCDRAGDPIEGTDRRTFPSPARVAAERERVLRGLGMGFRAPYLLGAARAVVEGGVDLDALRGMETEPAHAELTKLPGVGDKIADCVLLFAYGRQDVFPVDVWIARLLRSRYPDARRLPLPRLRRWAVDRFHPWAGYAQQYLFHHARSHPDRFGAQGA